ncbi:MAG: biotin carboxylase N-terminal domain-containing protein, partial [Rubrivivax sp.]|nr:biotin carboxylase N-terminal domain-containing protein [Rubrivivax sp.]
NRGEIACRIARTCRRLGLKVATVHSSVDRHARHVREIGESVELGGAAPSDSYLRIDAIVAAAQRVGADAVHPGFGFVSENPDFVRALDAAGLIFIGPTAETMERLGGKAQAKREAARLGVPVIAGSEGGMNDAAAVVNAVRGMPLPVLLKAVAGGGGRGMAVVETLDGLDARVESAMREAEKAFGNGELIVERYLPRVRHIEVQVAGDGQGHAIHLFERECTLQRRHQKVIEEAPSAGLPTALRERLLADAVKLAAGVNYRGLGTVEFVVSGDEHHFLEVNPRLQVEHPVTEEVTGLDLVELQLRIADTGRLPLTQADVRCEGHAFEARLCAEDAEAGFLPTTGRLDRVDFSRAAVRIESGVESGDEISP